MSLGLSINQLAWLASLTPSQIKHMEEDAHDVNYRASYDTIESVAVALHFHIMRRIKRGSGVARA